MTSFLLVAMLFLQGPALIPASGTVTGRVLSADGTPASGTRVTAMAQKEPGQSEGLSVHASITQTDSAGRYRLENVPPGRYYITAGLLDTPTYYPGVSALSGASVVVVAEGAGVAGVDFSFPIPKGMKVSGRLAVMPTSRATPPTVGLIRMSVGAAPKQETPVNPDGTFEFQSVLPGRYTLVNDFGLPGVPVEVADDVAGVAIGRDTVGVRVSGRILTSDSQPRLPFSVALSAPRNLSLSVQPDVNGVFEFLRVPPGSYSLAVFPTVGPYQPVNLVVADKDITGVEIRLPFHGELSGRVVMEDGRLLSAPLAVVEARPANGRFGGPGSAGSSVAPDGSFGLRFLAEGDYRIGLSGLPLGYRVKAISFGDTNLLTEPLKIAPGSPIPANVVVTLARVPLESIQGVKVSGRVTGASLGSLAGVRVILNGNDPGGHTIETAVNADGTFEFPRVPPGNYAARVNGLANAGPPPLSARFSVGTDNISGILISVEMRTVISGTVTVMDPNGTVIPGFPAGASLTFRSGNGAATAGIRPDGTFTIPLVTGEHSIAFDLLPAGFIVKSAMSGSTDLLKNPLKVEVGSASPAIQVRLESKP